MSKPRLIIARRNFPEIIERLKQHFDVEVNASDEPWPREVLLGKMHDADALFATGSERVDKELLDAAPMLKIVSNLAVGYNNFDLDEMSSRGVLGTNTPDVLNETTADFGFALLMATARRISESEHFLRRGDWKVWSYDLFAGAEIHGSTLGIIGMGRIGQAIARRAAHGFGMKVVYHNRSRLPEATEKECKASYVSKHELLKTADHVMLVVPYSAASHHTIGAAEIELMKPTATLVNIARGGIVDDKALAAALKANRIAAAGLDVFEGEPKVIPELLELKNVVLTPHIASATIATRLAMANVVVENLLSYFEHGKAVTPLNEDAVNAVVAAREGA